MLRRFAGALVVAAALTACGEPPQAVTIRLIDQLDQAEVTWPRGAGRYRPRKGFVRAVGLHDLDARRVGRLVVHREDGAFDNRAALAAPTGSVYRFPLELPEQPVLRLSLGVTKRRERPGERDAPTVEVRFLVEVEAGLDSTTVVLDRRLRSGGGEPWEDYEVDLAEWSGQAIALQLSTEVDGGGEGIYWGGWGAPEIATAGVREEGWDLLLISLDTLRADHLGSYGYERPTSPNFDAFAARSILFTRAVSASPWTNPSHRAMFTGIYPLSSGGLSGPRLAETLRAAGYRTHGVTGGGQLDYRFGFARGFDEYHQADWLREPERVASWLETYRDRRRFVFLHTYEIHDPYLHDGLAQGLPQGRLAAGFGNGQWLQLRGRLSEEEQVYVEALYDSGIAFTDARLQELFDGLSEAGLLQRTVVVITSDHGEQFFEHGGWRHGMNLYDEQILVPLLVHVPPELAGELGIEAEGREIEEQVSLVDLHPTLLDLLGVQRDWPVNGRSLLPLLRGEAPEDREAFSENTNIRAMERKSLRTRRYKYVHSYPKARGVEDGLTEAVELYDLQRDPEELVNLAEERPEIAAGFEEILAAIRGSELALEEELDAEDLDPDLRRRLEALGYLGGN